MSNLATGPLCGTEWWCPVVAEEHYLRWGILLVVSAWVMLAEWIKYQKIRPLIQMFQSKLGWCEGFEIDTHGVTALGIGVATGIAFQFASNNGVPASLGQKWAFALIFCIGLMCIFSADEFATLGSFKFRSSDSINTRYRIFCRSTQGPFLLTKVTEIDEPIDREFATVDELVAFVAKPKSE